MSKSLPFKLCVGQMSADQIVFSQKALSQQTFWQNYNLLIGQQLKSQTVSNETVHRPNVFQSNDL